MESVTAMGRKNKPKLGQNRLSGRKALERENGGTRLEKQKPAPSLDGRRLELKTL